ncbi:proton-conducting transporter transmembrane domain-containing protein [Histidinibacterium aquaticum]|uniref:NADH/ubiquinone/plastoquinone (Complex I) n=1 Tax=Histidinibacterium aquaticum TaxID=2613962 RepID=A0A5J5GD98_9RHOB|nr:proton-conducting transporter membrane subunit [Histidinibacterium aquaticum]KAA9005752.1 NADH/ubiquinone/plastoquinone (complex I) [Histidinibacterium aquaticum]
MIDVPLWIATAAPLALLLAFLAPPLRPAARALIAVVPLPALAVALADPAPEPVFLDWLLLGTVFTLTDTASVFLALTALLWALAGWQAMRLLAMDPAIDRLAAFFLLAMTGNIGLLTAGDVITFYAFFTMMSLASWGLILHGGGAAQVFAGRVYIVFAIAGEIALFAGLSVASFAVEDTSMEAIRSPEVPTAALWLMTGGLLVKLGAVPLHLWLPLAHAAAPAPASAVLSGSMLKAGLFGLIAFLPLGLEPLPALAAALAAMALSGIVLAPVLGFVQGDAKAVLAYSSIGQMSLMALGLAAALATPGAWPALSVAIILLAANHGFAKAALFLGVPAVWASATTVTRIVVLSLLALPALALAGLPATSGFIAKDTLKSALGGAADGWGVWLGAALFIASLGTALLMARALYLLARAGARPATPRDVLLPWLGMLGLVIVGLAIVPADVPEQSTPTLADVVPIGIAIVATLAGLAAARYGRWQLLPARPGEILGLLEQAARPEPLLALRPPPRRGRALTIRRRPMRPRRPEYGALAMLSMAAVLALGMAWSAPTPQTVSALDARNAATVKEPIR